MARPWRRGEAAESRDAAATQTPRRHTAPTTRRLRQENDNLKKEREELRATIDELNSRLTEDKEDDDA